jgi:prevent-host-death family protein
MTFGISEAKQKLSELVERAAQGRQRIITCWGKERARLVGVTATSGRSLEEILDSLTQARMKLPKGTTIEDLIEEGRCF